MTLHTPPPAVSVVATRAALERVLASAGFRSSPQLAAFLRFIVEATLRGKADGIRAYTIGTGALGREADFDPQGDPIVRVEANRLRRALAAYYDGAGADDPVAIDVPPGRYVPVFRHRFALAEIAVAPPEPSPGRRMRRWLLPVAAILGLFGALAAAAMVWLGAARLHPDVAATPIGGPPMILVETIQTEPPSASASSLAAVLSRELIDTLSHIQVISVASEATAAGAAAARGADDASAHAFRLTGLIELQEGTTANVTLRMVADGAILWTRDWRITAQEGPGVEAISRETALDIGRLSGVMHARLREQAGRLSPGYRCALAAADSLRKFDLSQHVRVRGCLERSAADDPNFTLAFAMLAFIYEREYLHDLPAHANGPSSLERSLEAARRALALSPKSVLGHLALMENLYIRGDLAGAFAMGEVALALNGLDPAVSGLVGLRLFLGGETERGAVLLRQGASRFGANPAWHEFGLFCVAYLDGDMAAASRHAALDDASTFPYGLLGRALATAAAGDRARARQTLHRLKALYPGWSQPRTMLARFIRSPAIVDRFARDLDAIMQP